MRFTFSKHMYHHYPATFNHIMQPINMCHIISLIAKVKGVWCMKSRNIFHRFIIQKTYIYSKYIYIYTKITACHLGQGRAPLLRAHPGRPSHTPPGWAWPPCGEWRVGWSWWRGPQGRRRSRWGWWCQRGGCWEMGRTTVGVRRCTSQVWQQVWRRGRIFHAARPSAWGSGGAAWNARGSRCWGRASCRRRTPPDRSGAGAGAGGRGWGCGPGSVGVPGRCPSSQPGDLYWPPGDPPPPSQPQRHPYVAPRCSWPPPPSPSPRGGWVPGPGPGWGMWSGAGWWECLASRHASYLMEWEQNVDVMA